MALMSSRRLSGTNPIYPKAVESCLIFTFQDPVLRSTSSFWFILARPGTVICGAAMWVLASGDLRP
jgi:hypothetical protein